MIFDRTQEDVVEAKVLLQEKMQKNVTLTEAEKETVERGLINIDTINRIEDKQAEVSAMLNDMGYPCEVINKHWQRGEMFKSEDFNRIAINHNNMRQAFIVSGKIAIPMFTYNSLNNLEEYLVNVESMADDIKSLYRECGAYECGGD